MNRAPFFAAIATPELFAAHLPQPVINGCGAILDAMAGSPLSYAAYALATAYWETAHTMQPVDERGGADYWNRRYGPEGANPALAKELGNALKGDGARYHGRGYVQLTGRAGYKKAGALLGEPLEDQPELAKRPDIAASIMLHGMTDGWFTGKAFKDYLPATQGATTSQFTLARKIINGVDHAADIADAADKFQAALRETWT